MEVVGADPEDLVPEHLILRATVGQQQALVETHDGLQKTAQVQVQLEMPVDVLRQHNTEAVS